MNILIIEDDKDIAELVAFNLRQEKFCCDVAASGALGLAAALKTKPDLILLDLMLPDLGGLEVCRKLKSDPKTKNIPILMLTSKAEEIDRIVGFEVGADDYVTKPFSPRELVLRVKAILARGKKQGLGLKPISFGILYLHPEKMEVRVEKTPVRLTTTEFKLLQYLLETKGHVATRDMLLDQVWGFDAALTTRTVDTHVKRLREKLKKAGTYIETVHGSGYRFKEHP